MSHPIESPTASSISLQRRFLTIIMNSISIIKDIFTEKKRTDETEKSNFSKNLESQQNPSPTFARRFRKLLPTSNTDNSKTNEISELPHSSTNSEQLQNDLAHQEMFDKLTLAYKSEKLKEESDSTLKTFISGILKSIQVIL